MRNRYRPKHRCPSVTPHVSRAAIALFMVVALAACGEDAVAPVALVAAADGEPTATATLVDIATPEPFGRFNGKDFVRITGRAEGTTAQGAYRVPFEIVVPADPSVGNGTVLIEPPHFGQRFAARDDYLGHEFLFGDGYRYASVGWATFGQSILDPNATDVFLAGPADDEIVIQFVNAFKQDAAAQAVLGPVDRFYGYGFSQTSWLVHRLLRSPAGADLFDFTMLNATWWQGGGFQGDYTPVTGVGKVIIVQAEGDLVISDGRVLRAAADEQDYRVYEVAGSAHIPDVPANHDNPVFGPFIVGTNPIDWPAVARAAFVSGDQWHRNGAAPPASVFIADDNGGGPDPVYGFPTGIARDGDLNALGGVRLPDVVTGRGRYRAADPNVPIAFLTGSWEDLACAPLPDGGTRFKNHGKYVSAVAKAVNSLQSAGFLLASDAQRMKQDAAASEVGKPHACTG